MKQLVLFFIISSSFFSYSMDIQRALQRKKSDMIILRRGQMAFMRYYIMNAPVSTEHKRVLLNGLKPQKKRRV